MAAYVRNSDTIALREPVTTVAAPPLPAPPPPAALRQGVPGR